MLIGYYVNCRSHDLDVILIMFIWVPYLMRMILQLVVLVRTCCILYVRYMYQFACDNFRTSNSKKIVCIKFGESAHNNDCVKLVVTHLGIFVNYKLDNSTDSNINGPIYIHNDNV